MNIWRCVWVGGGDMVDPLDLEHLHSLLSIYQYDS